MKKMKVAAKLISGFAIVALLTGIVGGVGIFGMSRLAEAGREMYEDHLLAAEAMGDIREAYQKERVYLRDMYIYIDEPDVVSARIDSLNEAHLIGDAAVQRYIAAITDEALESAFFEAGSLLDGLYFDAKEKIMQSARDGDAQSVMDGIREAFQYASTIETCLATSEKNHVLWAEEQFKANNSLFRALTIVQCVIIVSACLAALLLGIYISGLISKPLRALTVFMNKAGATGNISLSGEDIKIIDSFSAITDEIGQCIVSCAKFINRLMELEKVLERVADGDLSSELALLSDKDSMGLSIQKMLENLNVMFTEINSATAHVSLGAGQIAGSAQSLAQGATEQASVIDQLSASVNEISDKTKRNAQIAGEAAHLSGSIKGSAEKGSAQMEHMMQAVKEINDASHKIKKVINVIDDIAFQTNILALNASVEAARAGSAGRGFAVVADEVRSLAAKSAEAAKDTENLIENSVEKANLGLDIATQTSDSLSEITKGINRSAEIVEQIARSSDGQAAAISQINTGISQVAQVVQQNSATAEENAAASEEMSSKSEMLSHTISRFKLRESVAPPDGFPRRIKLAPLASAPIRTVSEPTGGDAGWGKY